MARDGGSAARVDGRAGRPAAPARPRLSQTGDAWTSGAQGPECTEAGVGARRAPCYNDDADPFGWLARTRREAVRPLLLAPSDARAQDRAVLSISGATMASLPVVAGSRLLFAFPPPSTPPAHLLRAMASRVRDLARGRSPPLGAAVRYARGRAPSGPGSGAGRELAASTPMDSDVTTALPSASPC